MNGMCCLEYSLEKFFQFSEVYVVIIQYQYFDIFEIKLEIVSLFMYLYGFNLIQIMLQEIEMKNYYY